jgi:hypothetical protein
VWEPQLRAFFDDQELDMFRVRRDGVAAAHAEEHLLANTPDTFDGDELFALVRREQYF